VKQKRFIWHIIFWLTQYSISLYNELYLSASFTAHPSLILFLQTALALFLLLLVKIGAVYYTLYSLIPRWIKNPGRILIYVESVSVILLGALLLRIFTQVIIWKLIYNEDARPQIGLLQLAARYFYSMLDLLQVVGLASAIKLFKLRINAIKNEKQLVQEKLRSELLHLKSQVNPHFLFNALNSIYSLARAQSLLAPDAIIRLSKILRYMLYEAGEKTIPLREELRIINDYMELQHLRFGTRLHAELLKNTDDESVSITPLLLLPLVENAFKHGGDTGGVIKIDLSLRNKRLHFKITNPLSETVFKAKGEEGIGLANIKRQLELLYRDFSLETSAEENTFRVDLKLDLETYAGFELFDRRR